MKPPGGLRWNGPKPAWPNGPAQWILNIVAAIVTIAYLVLLTRVSPDHIALFFVVNLAYFVSLLVLSRLYRKAGKRPPT